MALKEVCFAKTFFATLWKKFWQNGVFQLRSSLNCPGETYENKMVLSISMRKVELFVSGHWFCSRNAQVRHSYEINVATRASNDDFFIL